MALETCHASQSGEHEENVRSRVCACGSGTRTAGAATGLQARLATHNEVGAVVKGGSEPRPKRLVGSASTNQ